MKRITIERKRSTFLAFSLIILLFVSFEVGCGSAVINNLDPSQKLPYFLLRISEYMSKGNVTELARIRNQMVQQEKIKQEIITSTNGAVLDPTIPPNNAVSSEKTSSFRPASWGFYWIWSIDYYSEDFKDIYGTVVGKIENPNNLAGYPDDNYAHFRTNGWNKDYSNPIGGEACANGPLTGTAYTGNVYIEAKVGPWSGPPGYDDWGHYAWTNYVIVWVSDGYVSYPNYVGYVSVQATSKTAYYVGYANFGSFNYIYFASWTPPWHPDNYDPHAYNSVLIDTAVVVGWAP